MAKKYYLGLDQGTTGTTALLFDQNWNQVARGYAEVVQYYPKPGYVEHDGMQLYETLQKATKEALCNAEASADEIICMGLDNQGETVILWDKSTGNPIHPAIVWQDRRTSKEVDEINEKYGMLFEERTGVKLDSYFGATKIRWILQNVPEAQSLLSQGRLLAGTLDTWFIWKMTRGKEFVTDAVTASRTCLMNIQNLCWDKDILDILEIPVSILPEIRENACAFGNTDSAEFLGASIPITGSIVDQQAALYGQGCVKKGEIKTTFGTGCFMLMNTEEQRVSCNNGLLSTLALVHKGKKSYALDGGIYISGAAVKWLETGLKIVDSPRMADELALSLEDNGGVYFVPAFSGLAAPYWDSYARGMIIGLTGGTTSAHIARATMEATPYQVKDIFDILKKTTNLNVSSMRVDGGGTKGKFMMQFLADILGIPIEVPVISETTGLGAAYLAALGMGEIASLDEMAKLWRCGKVYVPQMNEDRREELLAKWHCAVERARDWERAK